MSAVQTPVVLVMNRLGHPATRAMFSEARFIVVPAQPAPQLPSDTAAEVDAIMANLPGVASAEVIASMPRLKVISAAGIGVQNIDIAAATDAGVAVINHRGVGFEPVAEHAIGLMLSLSRRITETDRAFRSEGWKTRTRFQDGVYDGFATIIRGKRVGIVGLGHIGRRIAEICLHGFRMDVAAYSPSIPDATFRDLGVTRHASLHSICAESDYVVIAAGYRPETHHLITATELDLMKPSAFFINIARGGMVDQKALYLALTAGRIAGAGIDVFDPEPTADDEPILRLDNVIVTPHVAGFADESLREYGRSAVDQIRQVLSGERPANLINPEVWERRRRT